jgi:hypothetical protein
MRSDAIDNEFTPSVGRPPVAGVAVAAVEDAWVPFAALAALVTTILAAFVASMLFYTRGHLSTPLDDTQIYFAYAREIAHGHILVFQPHDDPTSGSTSFLYPFVLAVGYAAGFRDQHLVLWGLLLNAACLLLSAALVAAIARRLVEDTRIAFAAAALVAVNGWLGWTFFSMMEVGLHATLLLAAVYLYIRAKEQPAWVWRFAPMLALLALVRPEMTVLSVLIGAVWAADAYFENGRKVAPQSLVPVTAALTASVGYLVALRVLTGSARTNTFMVQSVFTSARPTIFSIADTFSASFFENLRFSFTWFGPAYLATFGFGLFVVGAASLIADDVEARRPTWRGMLPAVVVMGWLFGSLVRNPNIAQHRWAAAYEPFVVLLVVFGAWRAARYAESLRPLLWPATWLLIAGSLLASVSIVNVYGQNTSDIYFEQMSAAAWLRANTPPDAVVAINDAGALTYGSRRRTLDLVGLTSPDVGPSFRQGAASLYEYIERLPAERRPAYYAVFPTWIGYSDPATGVLRPLTNFALARDTISGGTNLVIYQADASLINSGEAPGEVPPEAAGWTVVDSLDVADLASEETHGYASPAREVGIPPVQLVARRTYGASKSVVDGGRVIANRERMSFRLRDAAKPWMLLARASGAGAATVAVTSGGARSTVAVPQDGGRWRDAVVARGAGAGGGRIDIEIAAESGAYNSFHYWLLQPE